MTIKFYSVSFVDDLIELSELGSKVWGDSLGLPLPATYWSEISETALESEMNLK